MTFAAAVEFSNIRNINIEKSITLFHMLWNLDECYTDVKNSINFDKTGYINMKLTRPNGDEVFGAFRTEEAVGAFGAKGR